MRKYSSFVKKLNMENKINIKNSGGIKHEEKFLGEY